jgi:hydrogenase expression/formation protein HypC
MATFLSRRVCDNSLILIRVSCYVGLPLMCLAIPMQIESIDGFTARCQAKGVWRDVSLFMMQDELPSVGDFVMVHVGYAIQKIAAADARTTWELLDQILEESGA